MKPTDFKFSSRVPQKPPPLNAFHTTLLDSRMNKRCVVNHCLISPWPNWVDPDGYARLILRAHRALHDVSGQRRPHQAHIPFHPLEIISHAQDVA